MIGKKIRSVISYIFAEEENFSLEHRLVLSSIIVGVLIALLGSIINLVLSTSLIAVIIPLLLSVLVLILYYFVRFKRIVEPVIIPIITVSIIGISTIWIFNGGMNGSNIMPAFVIFILGLVTVKDKTKKYVLLFFVAVNVFILLIQFYRPDLITDFPTETDRWVDYLLTFIYSSILIYFIISFVHKNYKIERQRAEESEKNMKQLNVDKDRFMAILAHDLKSPFNSLLGFSEELKDNVKTLSIDQIESYVASINSSAQNSFNLLEDLLIWARVQQGQIPFKPQKLNFKEVYRNVTTVLKSNADVKNITVNCFTSDDITVYADPDMLKTILRNLLSNAIKFTNKGGTINISATLTLSNTTIVISDNGIGILPDDLAKLFDISKIYTTKGTEKEKGTGLGLLLCKELVVRHGGKIWVESQPGIGSDVKFTLPIAI
jgi:signal transduction histidine kinase